MDLRSSRVLRIGIPVGDAYPMGPGKAALLEAIQETGSISAAARALDMSYRKAWIMVDTMNRHFREPLVSASKGGLQGGGAVVTAAGLEALRRYRELQELGWKAIEAEVRAYMSLLNPNTL